MTTRVVITALEAGSQLVRLNADDKTFEMAVTVFPFDDGEILFLRGASGKSPMSHEWMMAAAEHFPKARWALWKRGHGEHAELHRVRIPRKEVI